jgi:hypothetical protein
VGNGLEIELKHPFPTGIRNKPVITTLHKVLKAGLADRLLFSHKPHYT